MNTTDYYYVPSTVHTHTYVHSFLKEIIQVSHEMVVLMYST